MATIYCMFSNQICIEIGAVGGCSDGSNSRAPFVAEGIVITEGAGSLSTIDWYIQKTREQLPSTENKFGANLANEIYYCGIALDQRQKLALSLTASPHRHESRNRRDHVFCCVKRGGRLGS